MQQNKIKKKKLNKKQTNPNTLHHAQNLLIPLFLSFPVDTLGEDSFLVSLIYA